MSGNTSKPKDWHLDTLAVHSGRADGVEGAVTFPIFQSTTYLDNGSTTYSGVRYTRLNNSPTHEQLHAKLAALCSTEAALSTGSGMAAIASALFGTLKAGDHIIAQDTLYGGTHTLFTHDLARFGVEVSWVDATSPATWHEALRPTTRAFYVEAISNPLCTIADLDAVVAFARKHSLRSFIDATFASPVNVRPATLGFDIVLHSATKYMGGHSDVCAGVIAASAEHLAPIAKTATHLGGTLDPHACFLLERGLKTLGLRVRRQNANALAVASALQGAAGVAAVHYAGLQESPSHKHFDGFGGVLSVELDGGADAAAGLFKRLTIAHHAPSLGGVETLVTRPAATSHVGMTPAERAAIGIGDGLVRVACGIEDTTDLVDDFRAAITAG